jgi:allophanate hydrolase subunit 1
LVKDSSYIASSTLLNVVVLNEQYKWQQAKEKLNAFAKTDSSSNTKLFEHKKQIIDSIYSGKFIPKLKSVEKASKMSTFFPGLGQCYAKNYGEGISSFLAITVTAGAMVAGIIYQYYFTSIFVGNLLIGKFYLGGIKRAEFLTEKYNYKKSKKYNTFLKDQIKQNLIN